MLGSIDCGPTSKQLRNVLPKKGSIPINLVTHHKILLAAMVILLAKTAHANVTLPRIFSDGMVLQEGMPDPIWGVAVPGEKLTVEIDGQMKSAVANQDGRWTVSLDPLKAGGPFELKVGGTNSITVKDVLIGEVWHASGQSNMHFPLNRAATVGVDIPKANEPEIRYFQVDPWHADGGQWVKCGPATAGNFSAIAFYFATELHARLGKPIGILDSSVNGAVVQTFLSPTALATDKPLADIVANVKSDQETSSNYQSCVNRLIPYAIRGVIWYQGEGNRDYPVSYQKMFPALIADWRKQWGEGNFPFLYVQLANYGERRADPLEGKDAALREAQLKSLAVPNTAMVVTIDWRRRSNRTFITRTRNRSACAWRWPPGRWPTEKRSNIPARNSIPPASTTAKRLSPSPTSAAA